jgi:(1->4)-alpha-D-glucan 1-alpha-D-glucosylmutase
VSTDRDAGAAEPSPDVRSVHPPSTPRATYRLQLSGAFTFEDAARAAPYLARLGVSHLYLSPILQATPGSTHGYDVVDHSRVSRELGGEQGYEAFGRRLGELGLGQVVDVVPNHMAIGADNPWWWDVLENGPSSHWASHFDVEWHHPEPHLRNRVLLPILGDHYGRVLEAGEIRLEWDGQRFSVRYAEHRLPVAPRSLDDLLHIAARRAGGDAGRELAFLADALGDLPPSTATDRASRQRRHRDKEILVRHLAQLAARDPRAGEAVEAAVAAVDADPEALDALLERQNYRLAWWRSARRDLGYRRFFDVTSLAGLRMEDETVFADTHALVLRWLEGGVIDGLRIDHPDGLRDPEGYFRRLRWASPRAWIVAEKILEPGEELRRSWPIAGTTGYDFLERVQGVLLDPAGEAPLTEAYARFTGETRPYADVTRESKQLVLRDVLGSELGRLTALLLEVLEAHRRHRDHTRHDLHEALREVLAAFPVYRTYVRPAALDAAAGQGGVAGHVAPEDEAAIREAVSAAADARPDLPADLFDVLKDLLLLRLPGELEAELVLRFQQLSGAVMAKGVEDTAAYRYLRLLALNEVGADAGRWGTSVEGFHAAAASTAERWPTAMLATSTHDTKRSEDVRARLLVLAELPGEWSAALERWAAVLRPRWSGVDPDPTAEYLLLQTLVGAWPIDLERLTAYLTKAVREAKRRTSWTDVDEAYERALHGVAAVALEDPGVRDDVERFVALVRRPGRVNSLSQALLKLTTPGVPDLYQGTELWNLSLVDPDNRRPVDFAAHEALLDEVQRCTPEELDALLDDAEDPGRPKLAVVSRTLGVRARRPGAFGPGGAYEPLTVDGEAAGHAIGFVRAGEVAVVVPRLPAGLARRGGWGDTIVALPDGRWVDAIAGGRPVDGGPVALATLLGRFPVALLERES